MSDDRTAQDVMADLGTSPTPGRASDQLDSDRMVREGQEQQRRQERLVDDLNGRGGHR